MKKDCITMEYWPPFTVELTYFKSTGKYYTEGSYQTAKVEAHAIYEEIRQLFKAGKRPGLIDCTPGTHDFYTVVRILRHPYDVPALFTPER
jgi:hypothetical protein